MGTFSVGCVIKNPANRERAVRIPRLMMDSSSEATWIRRKQVEPAGIKAEKRQAFQMANGQWIYRDVGYALVRVGEREPIAEDVFAEPGGARALEGPVPWVDARNKKLIEIQAHPVAKVVVPGKVRPDKDRPPPVAGMVAVGPRWASTASSRCETQCKGAI